MKRKSALLVVDVQLDFCPGGALPVPEGDRVVPVLNGYLELFAESRLPIFASRDWHPENSAHFLANGGSWPAHCLQQSPGARFHPELLLPPETVVVSKGTDPGDDGYSALQGASAEGSTLSELLRRLQPDRLYVGGLATDYCVKESVLEAIREGLAVTLLTDACRGVELHQGDTERALAEMVGAGAELAGFSSVREALSAKRA